MHRFKDELFHRGHTIVPFMNNSNCFEINDYLDNENWSGLDQALGKLTLSGGLLRELLLKFESFSDIEYLISIRGNDKEEEDGIWHDDGSRKMAFSLSLNVNNEKIKGGILEFKKKSDDNIEYIKTPPFGSLIIFQTGLYGYEHRIKKVEEGKRMMFIGWCS